MIQCLIDVTMRTGMPVTKVGIHMLISCMMLLGKASKHGWMLANRNMVLFLMR